MKNLFFAFFLVLGFNCQAQSEIELALQLLDPDIIADATLNRDEFINWMAEIQTELEPQMKEISGEVNVRIAVQLTADGPSVYVTSAPELDSKIRNEITSIIKDHKSPKIKFVDYSFLMMYSVNGGSKDENPKYSPDLILPHEKVMIDFKNLPLKERVANFEKWMADKIVPMLADFELKVDEQFEGVQYVGELLSSKNYRVDPISKFSTTSNYWRGQMEMEQWNQLILFSKAAALYAMGEYDRADRIFKIIGMFSNEGTLANVLYSEISAKREAVQNELYASINEGIAIHDKGEYDVAIAHYKELLKIFPRSAWLNYELYYSESAKLKDPEDQIKLWRDVYRDKVYSCDPLYEMDVHASNGKEAWLLFRRSETSSLFKDNSKVKSDLLYYADIAFDLEAYDFAAEVYWLLFSHLSQDNFKDRNLLASYLYCLDKLGCGKLQVNFKGDFAKEFKKIESQRKKEMEESIWYMAMSK